MPRSSCKLLTISLLAAGLAACDGAAHLSAQIVDAEGQPIAGARAKMFRNNSPPEFEATSDKSGCVHLGGLTAPGKYDFNVAVTALGYKPLNHAIPTIALNALRIVLAKRGQAFESQALQLNEPQIKQLCGAI